jgi:flagellar hook-associated protein 1 FlgK
MSISQALSAALAGLDATRLGLSVIAGNVANADTPGYVRETVNQVEVATSGQSAASVNTTGINRDLNQLLQSQLWTETSGGSYADTTAQLYQQLQQVYGAPGSSSSFDAIFNGFTSALQTLTTSPGSYSAQSAVVSSAQALAQNLNSMTASIQQLRTQAEQGIATGVATANNALQQIAQINLRLASAPQDSTTATLEDQRDQAITQLSQLMNITVLQNPNNQLSVFTANGQQLVGDAQASRLTFNDQGTLAATSLWSADSSKDGAGTIALVAPGGAQTDLLAENAIQSGQLGAYVQMRDSILPQAQNQLDELASQMSQALSNTTVNGVAVPAGSQSGYSVDIGGLLPGNTIQLTYTDGASIQHSVTIVALGQGGTLPPQNTPSNPGNEMIGLDVSGGVSAIASRLNAALGGNLQFSNPSGTLLQVLNNGVGSTVNSLAATATVTSLASGKPQLPLFLDGNAPITGASTAGRAQTTGLAGRISVNAVLTASPAALWSSCCRRRK